MKKKWGKPKLIILTRGKPEEAVLEGCKTDGGGGFSSANNQCWIYDSEGGCTQYCFQEKIS